jgi:hypothetical protein
MGPERSEVPPVACSGLNFKAGKASSPGLPEHQRHSSISQSFPIRRDRSPSLHLVLSLNLSLDNFSGQKKSWQTDIRSP